MPIRPIPTNAVDKNNEFTTAYVVHADARRWSDELSFQATGADMIGPNGPA